MMVLCLTSGLRLDKYFWSHRRRRDSDRQVFASCIVGGYIDAAHEVMFIGAFKYFVMLASDIHSDNVFAS